MPAPTPTDRNRMFDEQAAAVETHAVITMQIRSFVPMPA
jgi:hypothetical protein